MIISLSNVKDLKDSKMYLANGDKEIINVINKPYDRKLNLNLNQYSELSFNIKKQKDINVFDEIKVNQKIYFDKLGWFILGIPAYSYDENNIKTLSCKAYSAEYELSQKNLNNFYINSGDYGSIDGVVIYNPDDPSHSLLNLAIQEKFPNWSVGHVDESLKSKQRTFSIESMNVYSFFTEELAKTLQCIFIFDIENYLINVYDITHFGTYTDVYLSHNTVIKNLTKSPINEDGITNCIRVKGYNDLDIRTVNCGFEYLYDLKYFYSEMSDTLYTAWIKYLNLLESKVDIFKDNQLKYNEIQTQMEALKNKQPDSAESTNYNDYGIDELEVLLKSVNQSITNYEKKGYNISSSPFYQAYLEYKKKKNAISDVLDSLKIKYSNYQIQLNNIYDEIIAIKKDVSLANNFTSEQYVELSSYIKEGDYTDNTFAVTSLYTEAQIVQKQYDLKTSAITALSALAQPQYQIQTDIVNISKIKAFKTNYSKFALGNYMAVYINDDYSIDERLVGMEINLEDDNDFRIVFSNSTRSVNGMSDLDYLINNTTGVSGKSYSNNSGGGTSASSNNDGDYVTKAELSLALMNMSIDNSSTFTEEQINVLENMVNGEFDTIDANYIYSKLIEASKAQFDVLASHIVTADWIEANKAVFNEVLADYITTTVFNAEVGNIKTILAGNIGTGSLQTITLSAANTTLDQTFVNVLLANYITAKSIFGDRISTNEFEIGSDDNTLIISDGTMTIKDSNDKTRIQIGKDANGNFCFLLLDSSGAGTIIDQNGVTEHAIADGLIKSDKIADKTQTYSGIGADKLNINSIVTGINDSTTTIKSTKIYFDESNQTLNEKFAEVNTTVDGLNETIDSYGVQIEKNAACINNLITNTTITKEDGSVIQLKDAYNQTLDTVDKHTQTISSMQTDIDNAETSINTLNTQYSMLDQTVNSLSSTVARNTTQITNKADISTITTVSDKVTSLEQNLNGFKTTVSDTYTTKTEFNNLEIGGRNLLYNFSQYTEDNKYPVTANKNNDYVGTDGRVNLEAGQKYTFSCKTDGVWGDGILTVSLTLNNGTTSIVNSLNDKIVMRVNVAGGSGKYEYKYMIHNLDENWVAALQDYSDSNTFATTLKSNGRKDFYVYVKDACGTILQSNVIRCFTGIENDGTVGDTETSKTCAADTVEAYLLMDGEYSKIVRMDNNNGFTFTAPADGEYHLRLDVNKNGSTHSFWNVKIEKGNKATDWSPAPEDTEKQLSTLNTNYTTLNQSLTGLNAIVSSNTSTIATKADSSAVTTLQNNLTELTADLTGFKTTVNSTYTSKKEFNNLKIGGKNLIIENNTVQGWITNKGTVHKDEGYRVSDYISVTPGEEILFQMWLPESAKVWIDDTYFNNEKVYVTGYNGEYITSDYIVKKYVVPDNVSFVRISYSWQEGYNVKLERGNKATDWSPAPEDTENDITTLSTEYSQLADKFNWIVKSGTSFTDFTLTDRMASLTAQIISLNGDVKVNGSMIVDGAITANKIATDAIKSRNYVADKTGSYLDLSNGNFYTPVMSITNKSGVTINNIIENTSDDTNTYKKYSILTSKRIGFYEQQDSINTDQHEVWRVQIGNNMPKEYYDSGVEKEAVYTGFEFSHQQYGTVPGTTTNYNNTSQIAGRFIGDDFYIYLSKSGGMEAPEMHISGTTRVSTLGSFTGFLHPNNPIFICNPIQFNHTNYPQLRGNNTFLQLSHSYDSTMGLVLQSDSIRPAGNGQQSLGNSSHRWGTVYASSSTISTSDKTKKHNINKLNENKTYDFVMGLIPASYKFDDGTSNRTHYGLIAQDVEELLNNLNISTQDFAGFIKSPKTEEYYADVINETGKTVKERRERVIEGEYDYGLRYEEFIAPIIKVIQMQQKKIDILETESNTLKELINQLNIGGIKDENI